MAAGLGFKTFTTGEVLTAADVNGYLMQGVLVFASAAARNAAITSPQEGQFAFTKDTNGLWYYDGAAWVASGATGDIEGVTAGVGISGGGTSGTVTITNDMATTITASGDIVVGTGNGTYDNLPIGTTNQVLTADTTVSPYKVKWATPTAGMTNPMTTTGDTIYSSSGSTPARLGIGTAGQVLQVNSGATAPEWATPAGATTTYTLINTGGTSLSGSSTSITGLSGYNKLFVRIVGASCNSVNMGMKVNFNSDTGSNTYLYSSIVGGYATTSEFNSQTTIYWNETVSPGASSVTYDAFFLIDGANASGVKPFWGASTASTYANSLYRSNTGMYTGSSVISSVQVGVVYTTSFDAGTVYIYGAN